MRRKSLLIIPFLLILAGCHTGTLPNPNDPHDVGSLSADNLRDQLGCISDMLQAKLMKRQITNSEFRELLQQAADKLLVGFNPDKLEASKAWIAGEVLITARHWDQAKVVLEAAVEWAKIDKNEDRRVNDTLRLARVLAELGKVPEAIKTARTAFNTRPEDMVPILYATSSEIVPAARGKGHDLEVAKLLEDAIAIDMKVRVDPNLSAGAQFLSARPFHIRKAWELDVEIYRVNNRPDLANEALKNLEINLEAPSSGPTIKV